MITFDGDDFSEFRSEEVISFFGRSVDKLKFSSFVTLGLKTTEYMYMYCTFQSVSYMYIYLYLNLNNSMICLPLSRSTM